MHEISRRMQLVQESRAASSDGLKVRGQCFGRQKSRRAVELSHVQDGQLQVGQSGNRAYKQGGAVAARCVRRRYAGLASRFSHLDRARDCVQQCLRGERLGQVAVHTGQEALFDLLGKGLCSQRHDRHPRAGNREWTDQQGIKRYSTEVALRPFRSELVLLGDPAGSDRGERSTGTRRAPPDRREPAASVGASGDSSTRASGGNDLDNDIPF
jgi:hypothetical protein